MTVAELMQSDLVSINPENTVDDAIIAMAEAQLSALPVVDRRGRLVGVIATSDIAPLADADGDPGAGGERPWSETRVGQVMGRRPRTIAPDTDVRDAARRLSEEGLSRLFVEEGRALVGVIAQADLLRAQAFGIPSVPF